MKGNNELELNEATMIEAMQEYLDKRMGIYAPKVETVKGGMDGHCRTFTVQTTDKRPVSGKKEEAK